MNDTLRDLRDKNLSESRDLTILEHETMEWVTRLLENCSSDPENAHTYIQNAAVDIGTYAGQAIMVLGVVENKIQTLQNHKKFRKDNFAQNVMPVLVLGKLLKELHERGK
jgi:hypothetical protein